MKPRPYTSRKRSGKSKATVTGSATRKRSTGTRATAAAAASKKPKAALATARSRRIRAAIEAAAKPLRLPKGVRFIEKPALQPKIPIEYTKGFLKAVMNWPVYLVTGHGCLCTEKGACSLKTPGSTEKIPTSFKIPENTLLMSFSQGGDYCIDSGFLHRDILRHRQNIRLFSAFHSASDVIDVRGANSKIPYSFFTNLKRGGPGSAFPNIKMSFKDELVNTSDANTFGVYRIDELPTDFHANKLSNPTMSFIKDDPDIEYHYFLTDVIEHVYKVTGMPFGIFVIVACMIPCHEPGRPDAEDIELLNDARNMINVANAEYNTLVPTITAEEAEQHGIPLPRNGGTYLQTSGITAKNIVAMVKSGLIEKDRLDDMFGVGEIDLEELGQARKLLEGRS